MLQKCVSEREMTFIAQVATAETVYFSLKLLVKTFLKESLLGMISSSFSFPLLQCHPSNPSTRSGDCLILLQWVLRHSPTQEHLHVFVAHVTHCAAVFQHNFKIIFWECLNTENT